MMYPDILIRGEMGAGKTTLAKYLESHYGYQRFVIGDDIKQVAKSLYPFIQSWGKVRQRPYFQQVGQQFRKEDARYWVKRLEHRIATSNVSRPIVIEDGRPDEEAIWGREQGFFVVDLTVDYEVKCRRLANRDGSVDKSSFGDITERIDHDFSDFVLDTSHLVTDQVALRIFDAVSQKMAL